MTAPAVKLAQGLLEALVKGGGFGRHLHKVQVLTAGDGSLTAVMKVDKEDSNSGGFLHGAMSCLVVDNMSNVALLTFPHMKNAGVSVDIHMTYAKAMPAGEEILIKAATDKIGKRLAFLTVEILKRSTGELVAKGSHTKFIG